MSSKLIALVMGLFLVLAACANDGSVFETSATTDRDGTTTATANDDPSTATTEAGGGGMTPVIRDTIETIGDEFATTAEEDACLVAGLVDRPELFEFIDTDFTEDPEVAAEVFDVFQGCVDSSTLGQYIAEGIASEAPQLDAGTVACMGDAFAEVDADIFAEFALSGTDPTYVPNDEAFATLADVMLACDFESVMAGLIAAEFANDPSISALEIACLADGAAPLFDRDILIAIMSDPEAALPPQFEAAMAGLALDCIDN